jgi:branched-chain amino acid transport system permease protein
MATLAATRSRVPVAVDSRVLLIGFAALVVILASVPAWVGEGNVRLLAEILVVYFMAQMWNLLAGYVGLLSIGAQAFVGIGTYAFFALADFGDVSPFVAVPAAPVACAIVAAAIAPILFRLRDAYFAIATWVFSEIALALISKSDTLGHQYGLTLEGFRTMPQAWIAPGIYWWACFTALGGTALMFWLLRTRLGLALMAVRDNDLAASSLGIDVWWARFTAFVISAAGTGMAGGIYYMLEAHVVPRQGAFDPNWVVIMLFAAILGGLGTIEGPILGTAIYFALRELFAEAGNWYYILLGGTAVVVMLAAPKGLWGSFSLRTGYEIFSVRRLPPDDKRGRTIR